MSTSGGVRTSAVPNPLVVGDLAGSFDDIGATQATAAVAGAANVGIWAQNTGGIYAEADFEASSDPAGNTNVDINALDFYGGLWALAAINGGARLHLKSGVATNNALNWLEIVDDSGNTLAQITPAGALDLRAQSAPGSPAASNARLFVRTNAASKIELCALLPSGATQIIATEPPAYGYSLPTGQTAAASINVSKSLFTVSATPSPLFPANSLYVGDVIRVRAAGQLFNNSGGSANMSVQIKIGGQNWHTTAVVAVGTSATSTRAWVIDTEYVVMGLGIAGASQMRGYTFSNVSAANVRAVVLANTDVGDTNTSFDTTANAALDVIVNSNVNNAATTGTLLSLDVQRIPAP